MSNNKSDFLCYANIKLLVNNLFTYYKTNNGASNYDDFAKFIIKYAKEFSQIHDLNNFCDLNSINEQFKINIYRMFPSVISMQYDQGNYANYGSSYSILKKCKPVTNTDIIEKNRNLELKPNNSIYRTNNSVQGSLHNRLFDRNPDGFTNTVEYSSRENQVRKYTTNASYDQMHNYNADNYYSM